MSKHSFCFIVLFLALLCVSSTVDASPKCLDENGDPVDWWIILKFPTLSDSNNQQAQTGFGYAYMDANRNELTVSSNTLDQNLDGALGGTLAQLYKGASTESNAWLMYNDEFPSGKKSESRAHMKGALMFDSSAGFWLVHSVPRFPANLNDTYSFPDDEKRYGQTFYCNNYDASELNTIAGLLQIDAPAIYEYNLPSTWNNPILQDVIEGNFIRAPSANTTTLNTINAGPLTVFAKNKEWDSDLYENLIAPTLNDDMWAETWMNGVNPLPTYCKPQYKYDAINIRTLSITDQQGNTISWKETEDHSKWAITASKEYTCVGDMNRQNGQRKRGGGQYCRLDGNLWNQFNNLIVTKDQC